MSRTESGPTRPNAALIAEPMMEHCNTAVQYCRVFYTLHPRLGPDTESMTSIRDICDHRMEQCALDNPLTVEDLHNETIVKTKLEQGANPDLIIDLSTALDLAVEIGNPEVVARLLAYGADVNYVHHTGLTGPTGRTALMRAVIHGHLEIVGKLIEYGADIDLRDLYGQTALIYAANPPSIDDVIRNRPSRLNYHLNSDGMVATLLESRPDYYRALTTNLIFPWVVYEVAGGHWHNGGLVRTEMAMIEDPGRIEELGEETGGILDWFLPFAFEVPDSLFPYPLGPGSSVAVSIGGAVSIEETELEVDGESMHYYEYTVPASSSNGEPFRHILNRINRNNDILNKFIRRIADRHPDLFGSDLTHIRFPRAEVRLLVTERDGTGYGGNRRTRRASEQEGGELDILTMGWFGRREWFGARGLDQVGRF